MRIAGHLLWFLILTALTQIGGIAWLIALGFRRRVAVFMPAYLALTLAAHQLAPMLGREALPCWSDAEPKLASPLFCALNRNYADPALIAVTRDLAAHMAQVYPGTVTQVLDANFPFLDGFPLLPHLSHKDGRKLDIAFWYDRDGTYQPGLLRSPIGYFAFEPGPTSCPPAWPTLRWNLDWLQHLLPHYDLDEARMQEALRWLTADKRVARIFLEPHLVQSLGVTGGNIGFQGCRAARHDDHIHIQL